ncbi:MAG TPA: Ig-like domain-containing protein, partial [Candidatus Sulfopaludibacter sp.]|nr:Ig-like domain-containing protein [Candidatus Sulfopaludibacter sp.]
MSRLSLWLFVCVTAAAAPQPTTTSLTVVSGSPVYASVLTFEAAVDAQLGSVTFVVDGQPMSPQVVDGRGLAFLDYSFAAGSHTVTANYSGSAGVYLASSATPLALAIAKATPTVSILSGPAQIGQPTTLTAAIVPPGAGVTLGTVAFAAGGSAIAGCGAVVVQYRSATCTTNFPALGSLTISATYGGDANTTAASGSVQVLVSQVVAGVYVASTPVPAVWGQSITVRALVLGAQNVADPTGTVTFSAAGRTVATQPLGTDGRASLTATYDVGSVALAAKYNGDTYYQPAAAVGLSLSVGKAPTVLTISNDPAQIGQPVVLRASVALAAGSGSITGTVDFTMDGKPVAGCVGVPLTAGRAACQTSFGTLTGYTLGGAFSGDGNTLPSTASLGVAVNKAAPGVYLATAPSAPVYGQTVSLDALVLGATGVAAPSGSVAFMENGRSLATPPLDGKGSASALVTLAAGAHVLTAVYSGDSNYQSLASGAATVTVGKAATVTELAAVTGGPFTATVTVASPGAGTPSGLVQFRSGGAVVGTAPLVAQNSVYTAVLPSSNATGAVTAVYGGDANFAGSSSNAATVYAVQTIVSLTSDQNPARAGQAVVVTAAVSVTP